MALRRVFVEGFGPNRAAVSGARAHHLARVVRLRPGEEVELSDRRRLFRARVVQATADTVEFELAEELDVERPQTRITVALAVIRFNRFEWAVEKLTELDAAEVVPVVAERSDLHLCRAAAKRSDRWRRIAEEAAQQARRLKAPIIAAPVSLEELLDRPGRSLFFDAEGERLATVCRNWRALPEGLTCFIGPEGGWSPAELEQAVGRQAAVAALPGGMLRTETAAVAALAAVSALLGL